MVTSSKRLIIALCVATCTLIIGASLFLTPVVGSKFFPTPSPRITPSPSPKPTLTPTPTPTQTPSAQHTVKMTIPAAAFENLANGEGMTIMNSIITYTAARSVFAPVNLPEGAKVTKLSFVVSDSVPGNGESSVSMNLALSFTRWNMTNKEMLFGSVASVWSTDTPSGSFNIDSAPPYSYVIQRGQDIIHNDNYSYYLWLQLPAITVSGQSVCFYAAQIEYQI